MPAQEELTQVERDKLTINPDFDFREIAKRDLDAIPPNEIAMFKWSGVYHQLQRGYFMIRLRIPGGLLTAAQLTRAGELARAFGHDSLCITTRQCLQFHWVLLEDIYRVMEGMKEVGILTRNACGDVCRNVVSCSLRGVCPHEVTDTASMIMALADDPVLRDQQRNLPRKHKISVSGCASACGQALMNCQGWYPVQRTGADGMPVTGWALTAGGGLGALPHLGQLIFNWVPEDLVIPVARAVVESHNRYGNRRLRKYARLKIVVAEMGAQKYGECLLTILRESQTAGLERIEFAYGSTPDFNPIPYAGESVIAQRQQGLNTVRVLIPRSDLSGAEAIRFAAWTEEFGSSTIAFTNRQNLEFRDVPDASVTPLTTRLHDAGYRTRGFEHLPDIVSCVGSTLCNLAVSDTPNTYRQLMAAFADDEELMTAVGPLRINMNGCPNACAQHWLADIGLRGRRTRGENGSEEGFSLYVGGRLDAAGHIAEHVLDVTSTDLISTIRHLLALYLQERDDGELFGTYARRLGGVALGEKMKQTLHVPSIEPIHQRNLKLDESLRNVFREVS